jgi:hypothetical protein
MPYEDESWMEMSQDRVLQRTLLLTDIEPFDYVTTFNTCGKCFNSEVRQPSSGERLLGETNNL